MTKTLEKPVDVAERFLAEIGAPFLSVTPPCTGNPKWTTSCYWPNGDVVRDICCFGYGETLGTAIDAMWAKIEDAKKQATVLKTAAECKAAVIALIQEHDAAPASFRDAVDALPVKP